MSEFNGLNITDGTGQGERFPAALREGYFNVDEMTFADLIAMSAEFAAKLRFYNSSNEPDGNWAELFAKDETVVMAMILTVNLKREEAAFLRLLTGDDEDAPVAAILEQATRIDDWYRRLNVSGQDNGTALSWKIAELIKERLVCDLHNLGAYLQRRETVSAHFDTQRLDEFDNLWSLQKSGEQYIFAKASPAPQNDTSQHKGVLRAGFYSFYNAVSYLQGIVPDYFSGSLRSQSHSPALGLFMAFLKLYGNIQERTNRFTQRHLNFYYRDFLQAKPRNPQPDAAYLVFEPAATAKDVIIPKGGGFSAGKGETQKALMYVADEALRVSDARVADLRTLYFERDELLSPEKELNYITHVWAKRLPLPGQDESAAMVAAPLFGAEKKEERRSSALGAQLGFAVASSTLQLAEGTRTIELTIKYAEPPEIDAASGKSLLVLLSEAGQENEFFSLFGRIFARHLLVHQAWLGDEHKKYILEKARKCVSDVSLKVIEKLLKLEREDLFFKHFAHAFQISLTAENGWIALDNYALQPFSNSGDGFAKNGLRFIFNLGRESPPIVPYAVEIHGGAWETSLPMLRCVINTQAHYYPYSLLRELILKEIVIEARVEGVKNILAYNNYGQLDPSAPWNPLGPLPTDHSYFITGNYEAARKNLSAMDLHIEWGELPQTKGGFGEHYKDYDRPYDNESFQATAAVLRDGRWLPKNTDMQSTQLLFDSDVDGRLNGNQTLHVDVLAHFKPLNPAMSAEDYRFDTKAGNGFFKFTFVGPQGAFGHSAYPTLLAKALSMNVKLKKFKQVPLPNVPYTPLINQIAMDYTAKSGIDFSAEPSEVADSSRDQLFHIHPYGVESIALAGKERFHTLLPGQIDYGNLFIGLSARRLAGVLTLFFQMAADSTRDASAEQPKISWYYLSANRWRRLDAERVIADTTEGFLSSGIVTLDLPEDISRDNSIMPNANYWLRICASNKLRSFSTLYTVRAQALKVSSLYRDGVQHSASIPAGTIQKPAVSIPGMAKIQQLEASFGGRARETPEQLTTRISERLRHKNRASTPWDYERLVLERFPDIHKVKCLPGLVSGEDSNPRPGHVMIVVLPRLREGSVGGSFTPMANSTELYRIREYLQKLSPPFAKLTVRNPLYERIQVRCTVKFARDAQAGYDVRRLNQDLVAYLSPWHETGYQASFGWTIRREDIESYIRSLDYVDFVTNFSMLHIVRDDAGHYSLGDTARDKMDSEKNQGRGLFEVIRPKYPWSLAVPTHSHFIETIPVIRSIKAEPTGIDELELGNTFIINAGTRHG